MRGRILGLGWNEDPGLLKEISRHILGGGLVAMPTETVYGFGCIPHGSPLRELQRIKERGPESPFLLLVPGPGAVGDLEWTPEAERLVEVFWPGPLTVVLNDPDSRFPPGVRSFRGGVAVR
ncbi:MAG: Sua5/YciO/YrdC/YwlC family protein, partial [Gemmatimonadota bacterium]